MKFITFLKLSVVVISQLFSIFILLTGMVWIDLGCKGPYENIEFFWLYGGGLTTIVVHTYLAFRVGTSRRRSRDFYSAEYNWFNSCWSLSIFELSSETLLLRPFWMYQATLTVSHLNPNSSCSLGDGVLDPILIHREVIYRIDIKVMWWYRSSIKTTPPTPHSVRVLSVVSNTSSVAPAQVAAMDQLMTMHSHGSEWSFSSACFVSFKE